MKRARAYSAAIMAALLLTLHCCTPEKYMRAFSQTEELLIQVGRDIPFRRFDGNVHVHLAPRAVGGGQADGRA